MSTTILIPDAVAPRVREGARSLMRTLGSLMQDTADDPPAFGELHDRLRSMWSLLDAIGWDDEQESAVEVDLREHSTALLAAVDEILPMLAEWLKEMADEDTAKPARMDEYRLARQFRVAARQKLTNMERGR